MRWLSIVPVHTRPRMVRDRSPELLPGVRDVAEILITWHVIRKGKGLRLFSRYNRCRDVVGHHVFGNCGRFCACAIHEKPSDSSSDEYYQVFLITKKSWDATDGGHARRGAPPVGPPARAPRAPAWRRGGAAPRTPEAADEPAALPFRLRYCTMRVCHYRCVPDEDADACSPCAPPPPSRFRPPTTLGDMTFEHAQNARARR